MSKDLNYCLNLKIVLLILGLIAFTPQNIFGEYYFHMEYIGVEQGLEGSSIEKILQDSDGYIWFATQEGLYKYDGRNAKKYSGGDKEGILINADIYDIIETENKNIWVATSTDGIAIFNPQSDNFRIISNKSTPGLKHYKSKELIEFKNSVFVVGEDGIERIHKETYEVESVPTQNKNKVIAENYSADSMVIFEDELLALVDRQLYIYDQELKYLRPFDYAAYRKYSYEPNDEHYGLFLASKNNLYLYTSRGVFYLDVENSNILKEPFIINEKNDTRIFISDIYRDSYDTNWIVTRGRGVFYKTKEQKKYSSIVIGVGKNQLNTDQVFSIYEDKTNNIWLGTDGFYAAKFRAPRAVFPFISNFYSPDRAFNTNTIWTFEEFMGELYLGADNGIFIVSETENEIRPFITTKKYRLTYDLLSTEKEMFIGGLNGLNSLLPTGETRNYNNLISKAKYNNGIFDNTVTQLAQSETHLFVGTFNGVVAIEKDTDKTTYYNSENGDYKIHNGAIMSLAYDNEENLLWIGSETGVEVISTQLDKKAIDISAALKNISGFVNDIHIDKFGHTWIAVDTSLYRFTPEYALLEYKHFPQNEIRAIETVDNTLWMTTLSGLIKASLDDLEDFVFYIQEDGLYNTGNTTMASLYLESRDELLFGGDRGLIKFPSTINIPVKDAISPRMNRVRLITEIGQPDIVERLQSNGSLEYFENSLRFEFAHLDFKAPKKNRFQYYLEGFDSEWSALSNENFATYTNLKSGDYAFRVKVYDANYVLSNKELSIHFTIKKAKWKSDFAYFLYFIGALFGILFSINWYKAEHAKIKSLQIQKNKEEFISGYNRYALSLTELQSHQTLVRKFLDQIKLITGAECIYYKQFLMETLLEICIGKSQTVNHIDSELELTAKNSVAHLTLQSKNVIELETVAADIQILYQQMVILQDALLDKQKYNWNDYFNSLTGLHNLTSFRKIMRDEIERAEMNNLSLVIFEWNIDKGQFKENELLKRIQLLSYGDKIKDVFGVHVIATYSENFDNIAKFIIFLADENSEKIQQYKLEFEKLINEIVKNNTGKYYSQQGLKLIQLHSEFNNYFDLL